MRRLLAIGVMALLFLAMIDHVSGVYGFAIPFIWPVGTEVK